MTLTEFLLARIAEDEEFAECVPHLAVFNRDRIRAECASKRRIVDEVIEGLGYDVDCYEGHWGNLDRVLGLLALPYADHPDCRDEWKP